MDKIVAFLKPRISNYGFWVSIFALIPLLLKSFGITIFPDYENIVHTVLSLLVMLGLVNNPTTDAKWFGDDQSKE